MKKLLNISILAALALMLSACASHTIKTETLLDNEGTTWIGDALPAYPEKAPKITMLKFTVPVGAKLPKHEHGVINVAYMIKGELTVRDEEGNEIVVKAGDPLIELVGKIHYGENTGSKTAELVVVYMNDETNTPITTKTQEAE